MCLKNFKHVPNEKPITVYKLLMIEKPSPVNYWDCERDYKKYFSCKTYIDLFTHEVIYKSIYTGFEWKPGKYNFAEGYNSEISKEGRGHEINGGMFHSFKNTEDCLTEAQGYLHLYVPSGTLAIGEFEIPANADVVLGKYGNKECYASSALIFKKILFEKK